MTSGARKAELVVVNMRELWDIPIPMDDGAELRANVYLPPEEGRHPVVMSITAYGKDLPFCQGYADAWNVVIKTSPDAGQNTSAKYFSFEAPDPEKWITHGYAIVIIDTRGTGRTPGVVDALSAREGDDFATAVDWVGEQPWCNGNVGLLGMSYLGFTQWLCASRQPKHLKAILPWQASDDYLRSVGYHGGVPCAFFKSWTTDLVKTVQYGLGTQGMTNKFTGQAVSGDEQLSEEERNANLIDIYPQFMQHPLDDECYVDRRAHWHRIKVPMLSVTSWAALGTHLRGNVEGFMNAASTDKWLCIRQEQGVFATLYNDEGVELQRRFFDHTLKGIGDFAQTQSKVELAVRNPDDQIIEIRKASEWPLPETRWITLYLNPSDSTMGERFPSKETAATYRGFSKGITMLTEPFAHPTEIIGPLAAKLWASASTSDADLFLSVRIFDEKGTEKLFKGVPDPRIPLSQGWLRASKRELDKDRSLPYRPFLTHKSIQPLVPGGVYGLDIEIWPACVALPAGYRLGLTVQGQDFEHDQQPTEWTKTGVMMRGSGNALHNDPEHRPAEVYDNEVTIYSGPDRISSLLVPMIRKK
ncbi:uncharacterized protein PV06_11033 [Exophiala oligosperma]|uniref:Xaa-Pro dipeptidyl-peptidase C-terminal domain-containing protein n=1 Tax=Exophiala oligosperma TaxID=215243 RepID=A0A0D2BGW8_9EURO|nr:uncharacterized protein PV06_11033 [Exophiala oligosperma]KIW36737.1 hypothetical protein PV06_11033 [Exophiala oligosperma]